MAVGAGSSRGVRAYRQTKVSDAQVQEIRELRVETGVSLKEIGRRYGISESQVCRIVNGKSRGPLEAR